MASTHEAFRPTVGEAFTPAADEDAPVFTLHAVETKEGRARPFSLVFHAPGPDVAEQRMYRLTNATLGAVDIFLVPVGRKEDAVVYEAVFN